MKVNALGKLENKSRARGERIQTFILVSLVHRFVLVHFVKP